MDEDRVEQLRTLADLLTEIADSDEATTDPAVESFLLDVRYLARRWAPLIRKLRSRSPV